MTGTLTPQAKFNILGREWDRRGAVVAAASDLMRRIDRMPVPSTLRRWDEREALRQALGSGE